MMLSDTDIRQELGRGILISPYNPQNIQPASVDLTLGPEFAYRGGGAFTPKMGVHRLDPGEFILGHTAECVTLDLKYAAQLNGKSTHGREGLIVHCTAGFVDPGFSGHLVLEFTNVSKEPFMLRAGMKIAQLHFMELRTAATMPYGSDHYGSHYQGQRGAQPSHRVEKHATAPLIEHW